MAFQEKQLGQRRDNDTSNHSVYSPGSGVTSIIRSLMVCNTSGATATFRVFVDDDGSTYTEATAVSWDFVVLGGQTIKMDVFIAMNDASGNIAFRSSVANALTITIFGAEIT
jgi:hypothetical protein